MAEEFLFGGLEKGVHRFGVGGGAEVVEQGRGVRKEAEAREDVQVQRVVGAADEEKEVRALAALRTEEDGAHGASEGEEGFLEEIGVVVAGMEERDAAACRRGGDFLAGGELGEERLGVVEGAG